MLFLLCYNESFRVKQTKNNFKRDYNPRSLLNFSVHHHIFHIYKPFRFHTISYYLPFIHARTRKTKKKKSIQQTTNLCPVHISSSVCGIDSLCSSPHLSAIIISSYLSKTIISRRATTTSTRKKSERIKRNIKCLDRNRYVYSLVMIFEN